MTTRVRSDSQIYAQPGSFKWWNSSGVPSNHYSGFQNITLPKSMSDEVSPGYFAKKRRGEVLPVNPMSLTKKEITSLSNSVATWDYVYSGTTIGRYQFSGDLAMICWYQASNYDFPPWSGSIPSWPDGNALLTEALANARSRGFDVLTFAAEFRKTIDLISRFRTRTLNRAQTVARRTADALDFESAFAETWLEARYGWRILAYDIAQINETLDKLKSLRSPYVRGYASDTNTAERTIQSVTSPAPIIKYPVRSQLAYVAGYATGSLTQEYERTTRAGTLLEAVVSDLLEIDPLVTAWEVIPFSFIVDWFTNIGDLATAYSPFATENLLDAWITNRETIRTTGVYTTSSGSQGSSNFNLTSGSNTYTRVHEDVSYERIKATPSANLSFQLNLDAAKLTDLYAVFLGRLGRVLGQIRKSNRI